MFIEFYHAADDEADVPDKLELSFKLDGKPVQLKLERSQSIPDNPPVIVARDNQLTYWARKPGSVYFSLSFSVYLTLLLYSISFLPERDYFTFGVFAITNPSVVSVVCLSSVTFVRPTQGVETFGSIFSPFCTLATV